MTKFKNNFKYFAKRNILIIIMLVLVCPILGYSYSTFLFNTTNIDASQMYIGKLLYSIKIDGVNTSSVMVPANSEVEVILQTTSLNSINSNYKLVYETTSGVTVKYASDDHNPTYGLITNTETSALLIANNNPSPKTVTFQIVGGYTTNDIASVVTPEGYSNITNTYLKYDLSSVALFVNNIRVQELSEDDVYSLDSYNCTNGESITYSAVPRSLLITPFTASTRCTLNFISVGQAIYNYEFIAFDGITINYIQTFSAPANGNYKFEVWGAGAGGRAGYSIGYKSLSYGDTLYIVVGGDGNSRLNGGGNGSKSDGGGATHIATASVGNGTLAELTDNRDSVLLVAGGGGGNSWTWGASQDTSWTGGYGGGITGQTGSDGYVTAPGGTQTTGFAFGQGGASASGGGGGWFGGYGGPWDDNPNYSRFVPGGGGSGYVKSTLTNAYTYGGNTTFLSPTGASETGHAGNGYARITYIGN